MKWTNKFLLPQPIVDAVINDDYDKGPADISITGLTSPQRIRVLKKKYDSVLTRDVSDMIYLLLGKLMHLLLERANKDAIAEERFYLDIEGITVSGQADALYLNGLLQDYKFTSYFSVKDNVVKDEYVQQLNLYVYLMKYGYTLNAADEFGERLKVFHKYEVTKAEDVFIFRDWTRGKAKRDESVPQRQIQVMNVEIWPQAKTLAFLLERIAIAKAANKKLPECTMEERWGQPSKWAVMPKPKAPRSLKNHLLKEDAEEHAANAKKEYPKVFVEFRKGENKRCETCDVAAVCNQLKRLNKEHK